LEVETDEDSFFTGCFCRGAETAAGAGDDEYDVEADSDVPAVDDSAIADDVEEEEDEEDDCFD
jgi:hypothetical protein